MKCIDSRQDAGNLLAEHLYLVQSDTYIHVILLEVLLILKEQDMHNSARRGEGFSRHA